METYHRRRSRNILSEAAAVASDNGNIEMMNLKRQDQSTFIQLPSSLTRQILGTTDDSIADKHFEVGAAYEIDHLNLPVRTSVTLRSMRVVMVTERRQLNVTVRYPSIGSLCTYLSNNKISSVDIYPFLDEMFVMGIQLAAKVLSRKISSQEFDDNKKFEGFWLVKNYASIADGLISKKETVKPLVSQLKSNGMVRWGIRRQVKFLNKHGESINTPQSSSSFSTDEGKLKPEHDEDDDGDNEQDDSDGENDDDAEEDVVDDDDDEYETKVGIVKRKRYSFRNVRNRKAKKPKYEKKRQDIKKNFKNKCKKIVVANSKNRWSAERYKLAEENLLAVMKSKGAVFNNPILRPDLRLEARKHIGDTGLLDHLLKHMAGKIAPGGAERFRRRHNADGAMEYWLESADLVKIRKDAGVQDPYWTPPPGWSPGDCPSQDPICAKELKLLKEENLKLRRNLKELVSKEQLKEELENIKREIAEHLTKKKEEESLAIQVSDPSQRLNLETSLTAPSKSDFDSALAQLQKDKEQLTKLSDTQKAVKEEIGKLNSKVEDLIRSGSETKEESCCTEKEKNGAASEENKAVALLSSGGGEGSAQLVAPLPQVAAAAEKTEAEEKAAKRQKLKSGFRICKPQGTFLWPNMARSNNNNSSNSHNVLSPHQVAVQVEDLFVVPTPPSVSSSTGSAPPQLPFHRPPTSPVKPLAERRAVTVTVSTARPYEDGKLGYSTTTTTTDNKSNTTTLMNLNEFPNADEVIRLTPSSSRQTATTIATGPPLLHSTVKSETSGTLSAWECVGSSRNSNQIAAITISRARNNMIDDATHSRQQQQRGSSCSSSTARFLG